MPQPPPPEPKPALLSLSAKDLQLFLSSPGAVLVLLALAATPGLVGELMPRAQQEAQAPTPLPVPQVPLLDVSPASVRQVLGAALPGTLPRPGPNQKRAGTCDPEQAHVEIAGGCWVETKTPPPCPRGKQWEHDGRCWLPVAEAKPVPTTGEPRPLGVADP